MYFENFIEKMVEKDQWGEVGWHRRVHRLQYPHTVDGLSSAGWGSVTCYAPCPSDHKETVSCSHFWDLNTEMTIVVKFRTRGNYIYQSNTWRDPTPSRETAAVTDHQSSAPATSSTLAKCGSEAFIHVYGPESSSWEGSTQRSLQLLTHIPYWCLLFPKATL